MSEPARACMVAGIIAGGLFIDQTVEFWGQMLANVAAWSLLLHWLQRADADEQIALTACVLYATLGEIFLSLIWGLYEYRLGNIPLFVPPGHAMLFMFGGMLAARAGNWIVWLTPLAATPFVCLLLLSGAGSFDAVLFAIFLLCLRFGRAKKLYAVMFTLSLAMEIYGTWLGNWTWGMTVPWLGLTTINPPLAAGAFYSVLDMLVVATAARWRFSPLLLCHCALFLEIKQSFPALRLAARLSARPVRIAAHSGPQRRARSPHAVASAG